MKSGLEGRNNELEDVWDRCNAFPVVSMKSGLEGRNNTPQARTGPQSCHISLNEVRPGRPEQSVAQSIWTSDQAVSMKSGLEGRNNIRDGKGVYCEYGSQ